LPGPVFENGVIRTYTGPHTFRLYGNLAEKELIALFVMILEEEFH
jgi:hypothetical protein